MASLLYVWYKDTTSSACLIFHSSMPLCVFVCFYSHIFIATVKISKQIKPKKNTEWKNNKPCVKLYLCQRWCLWLVVATIYTYAHETGKPKFILLSLEFWWDNLIHWGIKADRSSVRLLSTLCTYPKLWNRIYHQQQKTLYLNNEQFSAISMGNKIRWCVTNMKQEMKNPFSFFRVPEHLGRCNVCRWWNQCSQLQLMSGNFPHLDYIRDGGAVPELISHRHVLTRAVKQPLIN